MHQNHPSAWRSRAAWVWLIIACVLALGSDLASKEIAFRTIAGAPVAVDREEVLRVKRDIDPRAITQELIPRHTPVTVIPSVLDFQLVLNPGAVFGSGAGNRGFFIGFTVVALGFALAMFAKWTLPHDRWAHAGIGLLVGGGLGNLYDRLFHACVRDFIHPLPGVKWPFGWSFRGTDEIWPYVSNLADLYLLIGIGILLVHLWRRDQAEAQSAKARLHAQSDSTSAPPTPG